MADDVTRRVREVLTLNNSGIMILLFIQLLDWWEERNGNVCSEDKP